MGKYINGIEHIISREFTLAVNMGLVPGWEPGLDKFGMNPLVAPSTDPEDLWEGGGMYNFSDDGVSDIDTLSSSDVSDVGQLIKIRGILSSDISIQGEKIGWSITNGQNKVLIFDNQNLTGDPIKFWRVSRKENEANAGGELAGSLYCYVDGAITAGVPDVASTIRSIILNGNNQTQMTIFTVPRGKVGLLFRGEIGMKFTAPPNSNEFVEGTYQSRRFGKVFKIKKTISSMAQGNSNYLDKRSFPDIIPALTDIKITANEVSANMGVWGTLDMLIADEDQFSDAFIGNVPFLQAIGQPGF